LQNYENYYGKGTPKSELAEIVFGSVLVPTQQHIPDLIKKILKWPYGEICNKSKDENKSSEVKRKVFWKGMFRQNGLSF
jgi:hypothetical protein